MSSEIARRDSRDVVLAAALLAIAVALAYANSLSGPFLFDDLPAILRNPSIRQWWPLGEIMFPSGASTGVVGRPIVNLSLVFNYALGGADPFSYHACNLLIHALATLTLFGLVRRTLQLRRGCEILLGTRVQASTGTRANLAAVLSFGVALLWSLHPLQTESVTFVIRRTESLAGLFYLLTLYCFVRAAESSVARSRWQMASVVSCLLGMGTDVVVASAPVMVWVFDRTFVSGTFRAAWRERRGFHLALGVTWIALATLRVLRSPSDATLVGRGADSWEYFLTQFQALVLYLRLSFWPHPLVVDYGGAVIGNVSDVLPDFVLLLTIGVAILGAARRHAGIRFAAIWFAAILATSSSFLPSTTQSIAEHRMYLPLVALIATLVFGLNRWVGRRGLVAIPALALAFGVATAQRNNDYANSLQLWSQTVMHRPENPRAHFHLANALAAANRPADAAGHYESALQLNPQYMEAHDNLAGSLLQLGRETEAIHHYESALRLKPDSADIHASLAAALIRAGRMPEAIVHYDKAEKLGMLAAEEHLRFGRALAEVGRLDDAIFRLNEALRLDPKHAETHLVLGMVLSAAGRKTEGLAHLTDAVVANPEEADARALLGDALIEANRPAEALLHYETALRLQPDHAATLHTGIANALVRLGRISEAIRHYEDALRFNPNDAEARANLSAVRAAAQKRGLLMK